VWEVCILGGKVTVRQTEHLPLCIAEVKNKWMIIIIIIIISLHIKSESAESG
jgi:hypothetical protein